MAKSSYLDRLPRSAQKRGDAAKGEIELVTKKKKIREIEAECADELSGSALGKNGKRIGILLEDDTHMVVRDALQYPSGATGCRMRVIGKTQFDGVSGVVALTHCDGQLYMRRIFRHPTRSWELEAVRGRRETGDTPKATVRKEVREELGFPVRQMTKIGTLCPDTALLASILDVFWVELGKGPERPEPEDTEAMGPLEKLSMTQVAERISNGEIRDGYTIAALTLAQLAGFIEPLQSRAAPAEQPVEAASDAAEEQ
jgi:ADP-ribose diphosphatase